MKRTIKKYSLTLIAICMLAMLAGCRFEVVSNGDFDGNWHLMSTEDRTTGEITDNSQQRIFWGVAVRLINIHDSDQQGDVGKLGYYLRFRKSDSMLVVTEAYKNNWHEDRENGGDKPLLTPEEQEPLKHFGIYFIPQSFRIEYLSGSTLIISTDTHRMTFAKQ